MWQIKKLVFVQPAKVWYFHFYCFISVGFEYFGLLGHILIYCNKKILIFFTKICPWD